MNLASFKYFQRRLSSLICDTANLAENLGFTGLVQVCKDLDQRLSQERFTISVLGEIKRGKSTLINAMLGSEILPRAALVCTAALCIIRYGSSPRVVVHYQDGGHTELPLSDLKIVATKKNPEATKISHIEIEYPLPLLAEGVVLVDTPGVNDTDELRRRITEEFIPRSDGVLFVLNAGQPFSDSEMRFLTSGILRHHIRKLWFVINAIDRIASDEEREEALAYCQEQIEQVLPQARLYAVSAKLFLEGCRENNSKLMAASKVPDFVESLTRDLVNSRWEGLIEVPLGLFDSFLTELERCIEWEISLAEQSAIKRAEMARQLESEARALIDEKHRLEKRFINEAESIIFEITHSSDRPSEEGLGQAICLILQDPKASDAELEQRLGHLYHDRLQMYLQGLIQIMYQRLAPLANRLSQELAQRVARLDTRAEIHSKASAANGQPTLPFAADRLPQLDLEAGTLLSRLAPILSLGFLLTGNLLFAAGFALAPAFFRRLGPEAAPSVIAEFRERLDLGAQKIRQQLLAKKHEIVRTLADQMLHSFSPLMCLVDDALVRARRLANDAYAWKTDRASKLENAKITVANLKQSFELLRKDVAK